MRFSISDLPLPDPNQTDLVIEAPAPGPGNWVGAASALLVEGEIWLAYRVRRPLSQGRGVTVVVARSVDGISFTTVCTIGRDQVDCESFERPALVKLPDGRWRLYLSCATWGSKHWRVEALTAPDPRSLDQATPTVVLAGDDQTGVKDPVIVLAGTQWHLWLCCHPLDSVGNEDRMTTRYLTSADGLSWVDHGTVLAGTPASWDARGARLTTVISLDPFVALYDGRPDAESNWHETTGIATGQLPGPYAAQGQVRLRSPHSDGAFRYASAVPLPDGSVRFYVESARPDGAHDLVTFLWQPRERAGISPL